MGLPFLAALIVWQVVTTLQLRSVSRNTEYSRKEEIVRDLPQVASISTTESIRIQRIKEKLTHPDLVVVFSDISLLEFTLNSRASFQKNAPEVQYLVVGMDQFVVEACNNAGIPTVLSTDIAVSGYNSSSSEEPPRQNDGGQRLCSRMDVVHYLLKAGYNVFLLDADIVAMEGFDFSYISTMDGDFISGHDTFPLDVYKANGFAIQGGFYFVKATPGGMELLSRAADFCRDTNSDQIALNEVLNQHWAVQIDPLPPEDRLGTRLYTFVAKEENSTVSNLRVSILGNRYFPTGCKFLSEASAGAMVRHPNCTGLSPHQAQAGRRDAKKASLQDQGAWYLPKPTLSHYKRLRAVFWSFPGSGGTMLSYTFERITGKVGSTNSVHSDCRRLAAILPGECHSDGSLLKVHPRMEADISATAEIQNVPRVILMRNPFDSIWSWYQLQQTGSHMGRIKLRDFRPDHFFVEAVHMAQLFREAVENDFVPYIQNYSNQVPVLIIKLEDLVKDPQSNLKSLLDFVGEPTGNLPSSVLQIHDHPLIRRGVETSEHVSKATAYASMDLANRMWEELKESAQRFGYTKILPVDGLVKPQQPPTASIAPNLRVSSVLYLTYAPNGGLSNQLLSLGMAIQMAQKSGRTLILPPFHAEHFSIFPRNRQNETNVHHDASKAREKATKSGPCTSQSSRAVYCGPEPGTIKTFSWDRVIDLKKLSSVVNFVLDAAPTDVILSELSLCEFQMCNTRWETRNLTNGERCLADYALYSPQARHTSSGIVTRATQCMFPFTSRVNIVRFGSLLYDVKSFHSAIVFAENIRAAAKEVVRRIYQLGDNGGRYLCAHLRLAGSHWEDTSPFVARRNENFDRVERFVSLHDASKTLPLYIATDNEALVKSREEICGNRTCLFVSDFADILRLHGLEHFLERDPIDYLVCGFANQISTSSSSSTFGFYIQQLNSFRSSRTASKSRSPQYEGFNF